MSIPFIDRYIDRQYQHEWLVQTLIFVVSYAVIYAVVSLLIRYNARSCFPRVFTVFNALFLTVFTVGCSGEFPFLLNTQTAFFSDLYQFQSNLHQRQPLSRFLGDNRLLVVDASHDLTLVPDPSLNATWATNQLITDRHKLTRLLNFVTADSVNHLIDMVVCDLTFGASSDVAVDRALQTAFEQLNAKHKLLIAKSKLDQSNAIDGQSAINTDSLAGGSVDIRTYYEDTFFSYQLYDTSSNSHPFSMAYELYCRLENITPEIARIPLVEGKWEPLAGGLSALVPNKFVPEFWITNSDVSREAEPVETSWWETRSPASATDSTSVLAEATGRLRPDFYYVGQLADRTDPGGSGQEGFLDQLRTNRRDGKRSIVFVGLFEDAERDTHQTLIGPMHGSVLLLNVFINLLAGSHRIGWGYLLYLFGGFLIVSYALVLPDARKPVDADEDGGKKSPSLIKMVVEDYDDFSRGIVDKRAYFLALILLLGAITFFNHLINIVVIGLYVALLKRIIRRLYHQEKA